MLRKLEEALEHRSEDRDEKLTALEEKILELATQLESARAGMKLCNEEKQDTSVRLSSLTRDLQQSKGKIADLERRLEQVAWISEIVSEREARISDLKRRNENLRAANRAFLLSMERSFREISRLQSEIRGFQQYVDDLAGEWSEWQLQLHD